MELTHSPSTHKRITTEGSVLKGLTDKFEKIHINKKVSDSKVAQRFLQHFPEDKVYLVDSKPYPEVKNTLSSSQFEQSKKEIYLTEHPGHFFKRCPGAKKTLACCNYFVLNLGLQCDLNCSYCYLQSYINTSTLTIYTNIDKAIEEMEDMAKYSGDQNVRVGTGETIDSLSLDPLTLYSHDLIDFFNRVPNWNLEFKTKSAFVEQFIDQDHAGNTIVSWSINPQYIIDKEEHETASLSDRLDAARKCLDRNFQIAFHMDPVIYFENWKEHYFELIDLICEKFEPNEMPYISLGALRYQPEQKSMMRERFGQKSLVLDNEMFQSKDGKLRYDSRLRNSMFKDIINRFKEHDKNWKIFLCMETPESWIKSYEEIPHRMDDLKPLFAPIRKKPKAAEKSPQTL